MYSNMKNMHYVMLCGSSEALSLTENLGSTVGLSFHQKILSFHQILPATAGPEATLSNAFRLENVIHSTPAK
jgi:hypothetical protein